MSDIPDKVRMEVLMRDDYRCRFCNTEENLQPHHIQYVSEGGKDETNNLVTLCFEHHRAIHDGYLTVRVVNGNFFFGRHYGYIG
jgi:5-methylcytosine-specific restriction endonuclease McrA